ncbi:MAG TPA: MFS transporter [Thermomicrobiales bacterium]|nr:MFS transporter [Thermomicrobiales bacterium]
MHSVRVYPAFRQLMLATLATNTAFWMYQVAVGWLALQMTDSPFFVAMAGFVGGIPLLLISLPAGVIIDRFDRRNVLLAAQVGVMVVSAIFALLVSTGLIERWSLLVLVAAYGAIMSFIFPTRTAIVPSLVERRDMANAVALNSASQNATRVVGPSLAGVLIGVLGVAETFAVAAVMQTLALAMTTRLPSLASESTPGAERGLSSLTVGARVVAQRPYLLGLIVLALAPTVLVMPYINLMPVFARDVLGLGSSGLGVLLASTGLGTVAGSLSVARSSGGRGSSSAQIITAAAFAATILAFSLTPIAVAAVVLLFVAGWMSASFLALNQTALQLSVEDEIRGRVLSIYLLTWGMLPFGQLLVGALASQLGTPLAMVVSCLMALASIAAITRRFPSLRQPRAAGSDI